LEEQVFATNVSALSDAPRLPAPTLLVVGEVLRHAVAALAEQLGSRNGWFASQPSFAMPIQKTRSHRSRTVLGEEEQEA
jgi:hypothetical protein